MTKQRHPAIENVLRFFKYTHLRAAEHGKSDLRAMSAKFAELAETVADANPDDAETTVALRKLLEAKDAAVRAQLSKGADQ